MAAGKCGGAGGGIATRHQMPQGSGVQQRQVAGQHQPRRIGILLLRGKDACGGAHRFVTVENQRQPGRSGSSR